MSEAPPAEPEDVAAQLRQAPQVAEAFSALSAGLDPLARARLAVDAAEWLLDGPAAILEVLDGALEVLGRQGQLGFFLRGLAAAARIGLSTAPAGDATPYVEALSEVAEAQGLWRWAALARALAAELDVSRGRLAEARVDLEALAQELGGGADPELLRHVTALLATLPKGNAGAVALGLLRARRYDEALSSVREGDAADPSWLEARATVLGELAPLAEALPAIGQLGALARQRGDARLELSARLLAAERLCLEGAEPTHHAEAALLLAQSEGLSGAEARAWAVYARWRASQGEVALADEALTRAEGLAAAADDLDALVAVKLAAYGVRGDLHALAQAEHLSRHDGSGVLRTAVLDALRPLEVEGGAPPSPGHLPGPQAALPASKDPTP